jgi:hypothetical protein
VENCHECIDEKDERLRQKREYKMEDVKANHAGWFWLIEEVKNGPVSDMICLIPKICHVDLFGDIFEAKHVTEFQQDYLSVFKLMLKHDALLCGGKPDFLRKAIQANLYIPSTINSKDTCAFSYLYRNGHICSFAKVILEISPCTHHSYS